MRAPRTARALTAAIVVGLLAGCAGPTPDLTDDAAARLQADVLEVSRASAGGDLPTARAALDGLTVQLATERAAGGVSAERGQLIDAAIILVAADLSTLEQAAAEAQAVAAKAAAAAEQAAQAAKDAQDAADAKPKKNDRAKSTKKGD
ncbi:MAG: mucin-associated surface protein [Cellulomonas sp.]